MADKTTATPSTLGARLSALMLRIQFLWFSGHFITVNFGCLYVILSRFGFGQHFYAIAYYGTIISYLVIVYKAHGIPQISRGYLQRIMMDENSQYLILAVIWVTSPIVWVTLIPYVSFSIFHTLTFLRSDVIPVFAPIGGQGNNALAKKASQWIGSFVQNNQQKALKFVAYAEIWFIMPYIILSIFIGKTSILTPLLYANFLRFRHFYSSLTKEAMLDARLKCDAVTADPRVPGFVRNIYIRTRDFLGSWDVANNAQAENNRAE